MTNYFEACTEFVNDVNNWNNNKDAYNFLADLLENATAENFDEIVDSLNMNDFGYIMVAVEWLEDEEYYACYPEERLTDEWGW